MRPKNDSNLVIIDVVNKKTADRFNSAMKDQPSIVLYFSPQCGHCVALEPEWEIFINQMKSEHPDKGLIARVRADAIQHISSYKNIKGFPTILALKSGGGLVKEYKYPRKAHYLKKFALETFSKSQTGAGKRRRQRHYKKRKKQHRKTGGRQKTKKRRRRNRRMRRTRKFRKR